MLIVLAAAFLSAPGTILAADSFKKDTTPLPTGATGTGDATAQSAGGGAGIGRLFLGLLVVVGLVLVLRWFVKRTNRDRTPQAAASLQVVATTPLAQGRAVHLLRVGDELVLVGSAEHGVTPLRVYDSHDARTLEATLGVEAFTPTSGSSGVTGVLHHLRKRTAR